MSLEVRLKWGEVLGVLESGEEEEDEKINAVVG